MFCADYETTSEKSLFCLSTTGLHGHKVTCLLVQGLPPFLRPLSQFERPRTLSSLPSCYNFSVTFSPLRKAVFLDRDGVINRKAPEGQYVTTLEQFQILDGVPEAISRLNRAGFLTVVVTNQRCIAKGLLDVAGLQAIHDHLRGQLALSHATIDAIYFCPHEKSDGCACRKPLPGMLLSAAADLHIDLPHSWMVGDTASDMQAGKFAGCRTALLLRDASTPFDHADLLGPSLLQIVEEILALEKRHH